MEPDNWREVKRIFNSALDLEPAERQEYLAAVCDGDPELRAKIDGLLNSYRSDFLEFPSDAVEPTVESRFAAENLLGRYEVVHMLGAGGMGEVYLAKDNKLDRKVAIKVLNRKLESSESNVRRFIREAKAASALNHPNILTIHEIGETGNSHFIVSEFVDGKTLRDVLAERQLKLSEILDIAAQTASALAAAHAARIIHRDVKPENIIVRDDGLVKVLDFGLAKLLPSQRSFAALEDETLRNNQTAEGLILGTVSYMSPEQARGEAVDQRTDIFSLGVVVYEMISGQSPFGGDSMSEKFANLINKEPRPLGQFADGVPENLQHLVLKMLRKDANERYQSMKDLIAALHEIGGELAFEARLGRASTVAMEARIPTDGRTRKRTTDESWIEATHEHAARTEVNIGSSRSSPDADRRKRMPFAAAGIAVLLVLSIVAAFTWYRYVNQNKASIAPFENPKISRATTEGNVWSATISNDGKYLAYTTSDENGYSLWTKHLATNSRVQIVSRTGVVFLFAAAFSPEGDYVIYTVQEGNRPDFDAYRIPMLGGVGRKLLSGVLPVVSLSPDGRQLAFVRRDPQTRDSKLSITDIDGNNERVVAEKKFPELLGSNAGVSWSPDGTSLATSYTDPQEQLTAISVNVTDGATTTLFPMKFNMLGAIRWLPAGDGLVVAAQEKPADTVKIWLVDRPGEEARPISGDLDNYLDWTLTPTGDGRSLVAVQMPFSSSIFVSDKTDFSSARPVTTRYGINNGTWGIGWDRDGRLFSVSQDGNTSETWMIEPNGELPKVVMEGAPIDGLTVTPDGRYFVFVSNRSGEWLIWRTDINGDNPKQLVPAGTKVALGPSVLPDSTTVIYPDVDGGIWSVSIDGGEPVKLASTPSPNAIPQISPDGKFLACQDSDESGRWRMSVFRNDGREWKPFKTLDLRSTNGLFQTTGSVFHWSNDSRSLIYADTTTPVSNLWQMPLDGAKPKQITKFTSHSILNFAFSHDGNRLALARGEWKGDAVLLTRAK